MAGRRTIQQILDDLLEEKAQVIAAHKIRLADLNRQINKRRKQVAKMNYPDRMKELAGKVHQAKTSLDKNLREKDPTKTR